jgi:hypothetical protein
MRELKQNANTNEMYREVPCETGCSAWWRGGGWERRVVHKIHEGGSGEEKSSVSCMREVLYNCNAYNAETNKFRHESLLILYINPRTWPSLSHIHCFSIIDSVVSQAVNHHLTIQLYIYVNNSKKLCPSSIATLI